jgi:hypothetical protein
MAENVTGTFVLLDVDWGPDEAIQHRNLGCPHYADCLTAANNLLVKMSGRSARNKKSWKLELRGRTWACDPKCAYRSTRRTFHIELMHSPQDPDAER